LEEKMQIAQQISSMVLALRRKAGIKVRQPLQEIRIPAEGRLRDNIWEVNAIIQNEVNVKEICILNTDAAILTRRVKPNFKKLGPKCGKNMKLVAEKLQNIPQHEITAFEEDKHYSLSVAGEEITIDLEDVEIFSEDIPGWLVANEGKLTVALDITVTEELKKEGIARELVNRIQNIRKSNGYEITDKIRVTIQSDPHIDEAVEEFKQYIANQVLANSIALANISDGTELDMDEFRLLVQVEKE